SGMAAFPLLLRRQKLGQGDRPEIAYIDADIELPRQGRQPAVAVTMQIDAAAIHPLPAAERVMAEDEIDAVEPQFGVIRDAVPAFGLRLRVVVAEDQVLSAFEARKDLGGAGAGAGEIAEMPNLVSLAHGGVP